MRFLVGLLRLLRIFSLLIFRRWVELLNFSIAVFHCSAGQRILGALLGQLLEKIISTRAFYLPKTVCKLALGS